MKEKLNDAQWKYLSEAGQLILKVWPDFEWDVAIRLIDPEDDLQVFSMGTAPNSPVILLTDYNYHEQKVVNKEPSDPSREG